MNLLDSTVVFRRNLALNLMGLVAPKLKKNMIFAYDVVYGDKARPFTLMLKEKFGNKSLVGCEIGFGFGSNAENLVSVLNIEKLYCVDSFFGTSSYVDSGNMFDCYTKIEDTCIFRINRLIESGRVEFVYADSDEVFRKGLVPSGLDFVYIDGNHSWDYCYRDIFNSMNFVRVGGFVGGHDFANGGFGVAEAVFDYAMKYHIKPQMVFPDFWFEKKK